MSQSFRIKVPASTSNLGSGFDTLGLALELHNEVEVQLKGKKLELDIVGEGAQDLPRGSKNLFIQALDLYFKHVGKPRPKGLRITMNNHIPLARGLGSSGATIISGLLAAKKISRKAISDQEIVSLALKLEEHPDNLVPALIGGLSISVIHEGQVIYMGLPVPLGLSAVIIIPEFKLSTKKARAILPKTVAFSDAVFNLSRASLLTASLIAGRYDLLNIAVQDKLHQRYRFNLSSPMKKIFDLASSVGGCGTFMSGAGPSILTFVNHHEPAQDVVMRLAEHLKKNKLEVQVKTLPISRQGAVIEDI